MPDNSAAEAQGAVGAIVEDTIERLPDTGAAIPSRRRSLAYLCAAFLSGAAIAFVAGRASVARAAPKTARPPSAAALDGRSSVQAPVPPANRITYYIVSSQEQADQVQRVLDDQAALAFAGGMPSAPTEVVVMNTPEQEQIFEEDINECQSLPGCVARIGNEVDLRGTK